MDGMMVAEQPAGFIGWIMEYGQIVAFVAQIVYWLAMVVLIGYAVWQYKKWVNFQLGIGKSGQLRADHAPAAEEKSSVSVEQFVE